MNRPVYRVDMPDGEPVETAAHYPKIVRRDSWRDPELTFTQARAQAIAHLKSRRAALDAEIRRVSALREPVGPPKGTKTENAERIVAKAWDWVHRAHADGSTGTKMTSKLLEHVAAELDYQWRTDWNITTAMRLAVKQAAADGELELIDTTESYRPWPKAKV